MKHKMLTLLPQGPSILRSGHGECLPRGNHILPRREHVLRRGWNEGLPGIERLPLNKSGFSFNGSDSDDDNEGVSMSDDEQEDANWFGGIESDNENEDFFDAKPAQQHIPESK